jgi:hypothetical protein
LCETAKRVGGADTESEGGGARQKLASLHPARAQGVGIAEGGGVQSGRCLARHQGLS